MKTAYATSAIAFAAFAFTACSDATGPEHNTNRLTTVVLESEWRGQVAVGHTLEIKGTQGNIRASLAPGNEVVVSWTKQGRDNDPARVHVDTIEHAGGLTICAVYPDVPGKSPNQCRSGLMDNMSTRDNDVRVDFFVSLPAGVDFQGRTIAGNVEGIQLRSNAFGSTIAGNVAITTSELATASTISGSVNVSIGLTDWDRDLNFTAVSGSVTVEIPSNTNASVRATAASGSVSSDFQLRRLSNGTMEGTLGSGGRLLSLSTAAGSVRLKRGS